MDMKRSVSSSVLAHIIGSAAMEVWYQSCHHMYLVLCDRFMETYLLWSVPVCSNPAPLPSSFPSQCNVYLYIHRSNNRSHHRSTFVSHINI